MLSPLKNIFWLTLHTASALAATIILNLHTTDTLTEDTTLILKHLQTAAALYYQDKATEAIRTYGYQPTTLWEAAVQDAIITSLNEADPHPAAHMRTLYRNRFYDILTNEPNRTILTIKPSGTLTTTDQQSIRRISGGTPTGSIPSTTTELLNRARRAGFGVSLAGSGHHKIWASHTPGQGRSVTIPATASDHRSLLNSIMTIRSILGIDLRKY